MIELMDFIKEELNDYNLCRIYKGLLENIYSNRQIIELNFNRYTLEIDFDKDEVKLFDDVMLDIEPLVTNVKSFFLEISNNGTDQISHASAIL